MRLQFFATLLLHSAALRVPVGRRELLSRALASTALVAPLVPAHARIVGVAPQSGTTREAMGLPDAAAKTAQLRAANAKEEAMKAARAETAIARMAEVKEAKAREVERLRASGVPLCQESAWGKGSTGLLSATACTRERDGFIEEGKRTGFAVVF